MNVVGIAAEYNPFHRGHERHLMETRARLGEDTPVVCAMSGDFVQRGDAAVFSKFTRAEAACRSGVDLVIELPLAWSLSSAEGFARGAVSILSRIGCTHLSFGSETGAIEPLRELSDLLSEPSFHDRVCERMAAEPTLSYAAARQLTAREQLGGLADLLEKPNNILAVEYLKAIRSLRAGLTPLTVLRSGSEHDGEGGELPSAAELRRRMSRREDVSSEIPAEARRVYERDDNADKGSPVLMLLEIAVLSRLRALSEEDFDDLPDGGDGLGRRLCRAVAEEPDLASICEGVKSKRYALSRVRRMVYAAALGLRAGMADGEPPYARVLAANTRGRELLRQAAGHASIPILTKPAAVRNWGGEALACFALGARAHDLYVLGYPDRDARSGGEDWRKGPAIV